jgi:hypothetical protein
MKIACGVRLRSLDGTEIQSFLHDSGLTFCELLTLARSANGSTALLLRRLTMIGLKAGEIDLAILSDLGSHSADGVARCAKPAAWPAAA